MVLRVPASLCRLFQRLGDEGQRCASPSLPHGGWRLPEEAPAGPSWLQGSSSAALLRAWPGLLLRGAELQPWAQPHRRAPRVGGRLQCSEPDLHHHRGLLLRPQTGGSTHAKASTLTDESFHQIKRLNPTLHGVTSDPKLDPELDPESAFTQAKASVLNILYF